MKERPKCKCGNPAITFYYGEMVCGECIIKVMKKENEQKLKLLEEVQNGL